MPRPNLVRDRLCPDILHSFSSYSPGVLAALNGDLKTHLGPHGDLGPQMGTYVATVPVPPSQGSIGYLCPFLMVHCFSFLYPSSSPNPYNTANPANPSLSWSFYCTVPQWVPFRVPMGTFLGIWVPFLYFGSPFFYFRLKNAKNSCPYHCRPTY